jgi:hypothetical protein
MASRRLSDLLAVAIALCRTAQVSDQKIAQLPAPLQQGTVRADANAPAGSLIALETIKVALPPIIALVIA